MAVIKHIKNAAYKPTKGSTCATNAKAIASGIKARATVKPEKKSKKKDKKVPKNELAVLAKKYSGEDDGLIAEKSRRDQVLVHSMRERAFQLTARRVSQENSSGKTPGPTTSIFKLVGANLARDFTEIKSDLMGIKGIGWEGDGFSEREIESTRSWLNTRAVTIYGGTNEVQMNIIAKRVLGLPD